MIVVARVNSKRIIKGEKYEVRSLSNVTSRRIYIKDLGGFSSNSFTDVDGNQLPNINWSVSVILPKRVEFKDLKVGDILVSTGDYYKKIFKDKKYQISELKSIDRKRKNYNGSYYEYKDFKIKFLGDNRFYDYNQYRFRSLDPSESREIVIGNLLGTNNESLSIDKSLRKIDLVDDKDTLLVKILSQAISDKYRHKLGVVEWACTRKGNSLGITKDDYKFLLKMPLSKILKIVENSK